MIEPVSFIIGILAGMALFLFTLRIEITAECDSLGCTSKQTAKRFWFVNKLTGDIEDKLKEDLKSKGWSINRAFCKCPLCTEPRTRTKGGWAFDR
jgi:hypothetical protein